MSEVTRILSAIEQGEASAADQLLPLVYNELRAIAAKRLAQEKPGQTLQATELVHEAYLRLVGERADAPATASVYWNSRGHFFAAAAEAMRRILIERARRKRRVKRGGDFKRLDIDGLDLAGQRLPDDLLALDEAIARLAERHAAKAELVKLRYFAGLTMSEAARALGISSSTADRYWTFARAWLFRALVAETKP